MKFHIKRASGEEGCPVEGAVLDGERWCIEIGTLEELMALRERVHADLILGDGPFLTIYDDYLE